MTRKEEIIQTSRQKEKEVGFTQIVLDAKGVNSAYGIGFLEGAEWADEHPKNLWKDACGTDLPEIDREVIALLTNGKVVYAHRPPERWYGRNMDGEESVFYPKTYDEGEWNQPDVKWWLDIELPKMEK